MLLHGVSSIKQDLFGLMLHIPLQFHMLNTFRACRSRCAEFPDEHEIRPAELQAAMQWLEEILGAGKPGVKIAFAPEPTSVSTESERSDVHFPQRFWLVNV